jgi:ferredoxin
MRRIESLLRRLVAVLDTAANRVWGWRANPLHQSGTIAVAMLGVLLITGVYLLFVYRVAEPSTSVARLSNDPWMGSWIRSLHRYATDVFILAVLVHALRMAAQARSWGRRTLAWVSGVVLLAIGLASAWTGFVMVWDSFAERLARDGTRLFDFLPLLSEPSARIVAGDAPVPSAFFFVLTFFHIALPLALGAGLWVHVSRVARPSLLPPRRLAWTLTAVLVAAAIVLPVPAGAAADPFTLQTSTPVSLVFAWWLPLSERLGPGLTWALSLIVVLGALMVPRFARRERTGLHAPSVVDPALCTGCNQCPQDCPWEAITMVPRDDDRPTLVALVDPSKCVSCGICAASCAPMGVGPTGRTGRDQLAAIRGGLLAELAEADRQPDESPPVVAMLCSRAPGNHVEALRQRGARIHTVPCAGNLHTSVIELTLRAGAPGVIVYGCPPRDCTGREGPKWLHERVYNDREAELQARVDRRRISIATCAPGNLRGTLDAYDELEARALALGPTSRSSTVDAEIECDPPQAIGAADTVGAES